jgi:hypothetical protein
VIVVETSRWPETSRHRGDAKAIEGERGGVEVVVRLNQCGDAGRDGQLLDEGLARTTAIDAIVAAEAAPTGGGVERGRRAWRSRIALRRRRDRRRGARRRERAPPRRA